MRPYPKLSNNARWKGEQQRKDCALDIKSKKVGFGSWHERQYNDYTCEELYAKQGHRDRVRTVDLTPEDHVEREANDDDSQENSDLHKRTGHRLLRQGEVPRNLRPNRTRAYICLLWQERQTASPHGIRRTSSQAYHRSNVVAFGSN